MKIYRILVPGKAERDTHFFMMDVWFSLEKARAYLANSELLKGRGAKIVSIHLEENDS